MPSSSYYQSFEPRKFVNVCLEFLCSRNQLLHEVVQSIREIIESGRAFSGEILGEGGREDKTIDNRQRECFPEFAG